MASIPFLRREIWRVVIFFLFFYPLNLTRQITALLEEDQIIFNLLNFGMKAALLSVS